MARIIILFSLYFFLFSKCAFPAKSEPQSTQQEQWHTLQIGFNLSYPDRVPKQELALSRIAELGIRHVRIYEIFDGKGGISYQKRLRRALDVVLKHGMIPMLSISNVPADLMPDEQERKKLEQLLPPRVAGKVTKVLQYSNRFPPNKLQHYRKKIREFVDFLFETYGRDQVVLWWFEIGNEPDAPLYYWGTPVQFKRMAEVAIEVLRKNGLRHVGGYGVTPHAIFPNESNEAKSRAYGRLMYDIFSITDDDGFVSFHLYERDNQQALPEPLRGLPEWLGSGGKRVMITEWNVSSQGHKAAKVFHKSGAWGREFLQLLIDCHRYKFTRLYLFHLMDYPRSSSLTLGAFNCDGKPKMWFYEFAAIWQVIRDGYLIQPLPYNGISIQGRNGARIIVAGERAVDVDTDYYRFAYSAYKNHIRQVVMVSTGEWAVLEPIMIMVQ